MSRAGVFALVLVLCFAATAFAKSSNMEINKGTFLLGGSSTGGLLLGNHKLKPDEGDDTDIGTTTFQVLAYGGYFVMNRLAVGPIVGFDYGKAEVDQKTTDTTATFSSWDIGAQGFYIYPLAKRDSWAPFGALALEYMSGKIEYETEVAGTKNKTKNDMSGWSATPRGGIMFFLHPRFALDLSVFLKYMSGSGSTDPGTTKTDFDVTSTTYGLMIGLNGFLK